MASYPTDRLHRRSLRLKGYDYAQQGAYFVTVCTRDRETVFGQIAGGEMSFGPFGEIVRAQWHALPARFPGIEVDEFVVMPNHIHGIIVIAGRDATDAVEPGRVGATLAVARGDLVTAGRATANRATVKVAPTVGVIIGAYKSLCVHVCLEWIALHEPDRRLGPLWQRNYYEHVIRDESDLDRIRQYVSDNPARWDEDHENPLAAARRMR